MKGVQKVLSGPLGGDAQIATMVSEGKLSAVIFFRDPLGKHAHEVDVSMLMRLCDVHNVPLATNYKRSYLYQTLIKKMKLITTHPIKKSDLGLHNNLFGGKLLNGLIKRSIYY